MSISVRNYSDSDVIPMRRIWNAEVEKGIYPEANGMSLQEARNYFAARKYVAVAAEDGRVAGLYCVSPTGTGRTGHVACARYAAADEKILAALIADSVEYLSGEGYRSLVLNWVSAENRPLQKLLKKAGFAKTGTVPEACKLKDGSCTDLLIYCLRLPERKPEPDAEPEEKAVEKK